MTQAQRAQQKGQDRHLKRMKARTNRIARAERQMEAGEAEGAEEEAVAWANSRVDVRGQPAFSGAHMRFNATTGNMPAHSSTELVHSSDHTSSQLPSYSSTEIVHSSDHTSTQVLGTRRIDERTVRGGKSTMRLVDEE
jgi:hypothetical protein